SKSNGSSPYCSITITRHPRPPSRSAHRSAVLRLPRREPAGAGVTIPTCSGVIRFSDSYDDGAPPETVMRLPFLLAALGLAAAAPARAHAHVLLPDRHSVKRGDKVTLTYVFGHPFEHDLFDTEKPAKA